MKKWINGFVILNVVMILLVVPLSVFAQVEKNNNGDDLELMKQHDSSLIDGVQKSDSCNATTKEQQEECIRRHKEYDRQLETSAKMQEQYLQQQEETKKQLELSKDMQNRAVEILSSQEEHSQRYDLLLDKQEEQLKRFDNILIKWEAQQEQYQKYLRGLENK